MQVLKVSVGTRGLVLSHRVYKRVSSTRVLHKETAHARAERTKVSSGVEHGADHSKGNSCDAEDLDAHLEELLGIEIPALAQDIADVEKLHDTPNSKRSELFKRLERREADDRDLNGASSANRVEECVGPVQRTGELTVDDEDNRVQTDEVEYKDVPSPGSDHIEVREASKNAKNPGLVVTQGSAPEEEGHTHGSNSDGLVVVASSDGAHGVSRDAGHDQRCEGASVTAAGALGGKKTYEDGGRDSKPGGHVAADVVKGHGHTE